MNGRRLYEHFCDARHSTISNRPGTVANSNLRESAPVAWPYLPWREQNMWTDLAKRVTPRKRSS